MIFCNKLSNFKVFGVSRQNSEATLRNLKTLNNETTEVEIYNTDLTNTTEVFNLINRIKPSQIYNLSGPSSVYDSLANQKYFQETINSIFDNLANSCIKQNHFPAFFQACSSEMFSIKNTMPLNEESTFEPRSPYASAKYEIFNKVNSLKEQFDWNIKSGIMFNHESEFRNKDYLFMKIFNSAKKIKNKPKINKETTLAELKLEIEKLDAELEKNYAEVSIRPGFFEKYKTKKATIEKLMHEWEKLEEELESIN